MLQFALLLLGCALSLYIWGIDKTVASVVISFTSYGVAYYTFMVVAGTVSPSCLYCQGHSGPILITTPNEQLYMVHLSLY